MGSWVFVRFDIYTVVVDEEKFLWRFGRVRALKGIWKECFFFMDIFFRGREGSFLDMLLNVGLKRALY